MQIFNYKDKNFRDFLFQANSFDDNVFNSVRGIVNDVQKNGDQALINLCNKFDGCSFGQSEDLLVSEGEIDRAQQNLDPRLKAAIENSYQRVKSYHQKQLPNNFRYQDEIGVELGNLWRAVSRVGVYVPGGTATYPSSVIMSAVPAIVAGVKNIAIFSPSNNGKVDDAVLYAAKICGITEIYKVGGAQAVAAMALGTKSIARVDTVVGPGNSYVAMAKKILYGLVGIDMIAGPTDLTIVCDQASVPADYVACDALSQLEHGVDSRVFVVTDSEDYGREVIAAIDKFAAQLSRKDIIAKSKLNSAVILIDDIFESYQVVNDIAPEHLEIICQEEEVIANKVRNAGAIFLGKYTPEPIGDYMAGPSHTLPTSGNARFSSGLSVFDFLKRISLIKCSQESFEKLADDTEILSQSEGFTAHSLSVEIRRGKNEV